MTITACYIFLEVVKGSVMIESGLNAVAGRLFILY
jgi:hypothetical protein